MSLSALVYFFKIGVLEEACRFGKTLDWRLLRAQSGYSRKPGFTVTRLRPLARRRESTACPLLVFIRLRKPCFFDRRRRRGWNVRFGMERPDSYSENFTMDKL